MPVCCVLPLLGCSSSVCSMQLCAFWRIKKRELLVLTIKNLHKSPSLFICLLFLLARALTLLLCYICLLWYSLSSFVLPKIPLSLPHCHPQAWNTLPESRLAGRASLLLAMFAQSFHLCRLVLVYYRSSDSLLPQIGAWANKQIAVQRWVARGMNLDVGLQPSLESSLATRLRM